MKFSEFKQACRGILDRIGAAKFRSAQFKLHDVESSSQFAQAVFPAGGVDAANGLLNIRPGRRPTTLAEILSKAADLAERLGGDPEMTTAGDRAFVFGYDQQQNAAVASFDLPIEEEVDESVLDAPKPDMDPAVWRETGTGKPELTEEAERVVAGVTEWAMRSGWISPDTGVHIVGSIASNQYSDESDIDVHFYGNGLDFKGKDPDDFNAEMRAAFKKFIAANPRYADVGGHPVEVYAQRNRFQDMMSVGCYDAKTKTWEVGPDVKDTSFDPYSEFYEDDMKYMDGIVDDVRQAILKSYEKAIVLSRSREEAFKKKIGGQLLSEIRKTSRLFEKIKGMRKVVSQPKSAEDAAKKRTDRRWHIADSAFKLLDKFGYTAVCRECQRVEDGKLDAEEAARAVLDSVAKNLAKNTALSEDDRAAFGGGTLAEGFGSTLRAAALAGMTMAAGLAGAAQKPASQVATRPAIVRTARPGAARTVKEPSYAGLSRSNMTNLLATIAYNEAMIDWLKDRNDDKLIAVLNVVDNRAGKDPNKYASVISAKSQFFSAKHVKGGYVDRTYKTYDPNDEAKAEGGRLSPRQKKCWALCQKYARDMLDKKLPSKIGNRNMIANKGKDDAASYEAWGKKCDLTIGDHAFGYDPAHDPDAKKTPKKYVVKAGDTLSAIAKAHGTTTDELAKKNGIKNPDKIRIGQKLKI